MLPRLFERGARGERLSGTALISPGRLPSDGGFGVWFYHTYGRADEGRQPFLEIWVSDRDYAIREAIASAHHAALVSGHKRSLVRFWKRKGDGIFTAEEAKVGWSCDSRYPLTGMFLWEQIRAPAELGTARVRRTIFYRGDAGVTVLIYSAYRRHRDSAYRAGRFDRWIKVENRAHAAFSRVIDQF